jgi:hypothetical protein
LAKFDHAPYVEFALGRSKLTSATTLLMPCAPDGRPARIEFLERGQHGVAVWRPQGADLALFGFHDPPPFEWRGLRVDLFGVRVAVVRLDASGELRSATVLSPRLGAMTPVQGRADLA